MDFLASIIKRPKSIATTGITTNQPTTMDALEAASPTNDCSTPRDKEGLPLVSAHLDTLLQSASEDLQRLEEQHCNLIMEPISSPLPAHEDTSSSRESIQKFLSEINFNLNQVSDNEMEHLQAMSGELSPLAVKPIPKPTSMEQQKAMAAALGHQTAVAGGLQLDADMVPKFGGLPEFDETQIPELAPLSTDIDTQLKSNHSDSDVFVECLSLHSERYTGDRSELEAYSSALNDVLEQQLSMSSVSALEAEFKDPLQVSQHNNDSYEAMDVDEINETMEMLKDVLESEDHHLMQTHILSVSQSKKENSEQYNQNQEQKIDQDQLAKHPGSNSDAKEPPLIESVLPEESGTPLPEPELALTALDSANDLAKHHEEKQKDTEDVFQKEDHHPICSAQMRNAQNPLEYLNQEKFSVAVESPERTCTAINLEQNASPAIEATEDRTVEELEHMEVDDSMRVDETIMLASSRQEQNNAHSPAPSKSFLKLCGKNDKDFQDNKMDNKTAGIESPLKMDEIEIPVESVPAALTLPLPTLQTESKDLPLSPPIPTHRPKTAEELEFLALRELPLPDDVPTGEKVGVKKLSHGRTLVAAVTPTQLRSTTHLSLDLDGNRSTASLPQPTSPSFPISEPAEKQSHFPRSPHAPPEQKEMPYLEEAVVEPSSNRKESVFEAGVIAKSAIVFELTQPSPQKQDLNETLPMSEISPTPLNMTFDSESITESKSQKGTENIEASSTFAVSLGSVDDNQRRTFSVLQSTTEEKEDKSRRTFCMQKENPRRTFCMEQNASPALEATENTGADDFKDVDISMKGDDVAAMKSPQQTLKDRQAPISNSPPIPTHQHLNRLPIHEAKFPVSPLGNGTVVLEEQALSAKEQATLSASDEKDDVFLEHFGVISPVSDDMFRTISGSDEQAKIRVNADVEIGGKNAAAMNRKRGGATGEQEAIIDPEFQDGANIQNLILNSSDFDYLYTKGSNNAPIDRSSLLLKFDPLLGVPVAVNHPNQQEQALQNILGSNQYQNRLLSPTLEEHETSDGNQSAGLISSAKDTAKKWDFKPPVYRTKKHVKMSVDVIDNDCNKTFDNSNPNTEDKTQNYNDMDELEKKIKNEVTRSEDIEKKLKEGEQREEALIKRITEKDKTNAKLNGVIEAYEKAIAELISEKEQQAQLHERQLQEVQTDRDANYHHLTSLETTFSDLHVKYEKSKEMTSQLKSNEESLLAERKQMMDNLRLQEQRYDKMKNHAMQQLEIANKKLDTYAREHADETKKLKALLKKEEISRVSMTEQLQQKSRENADLLKICEELIYGKGQGGS
ncbi:uncharacterized protein LOC6551753 isoform X1 [Drosophila erecta]|uniref:uncharacterized protein LOC6551753 isoform X1 n=1 Tax=Drosophila erecta TaxID=7220 RepID=UPI000732ADDA|nr:uncharacterized protein LOC6551753 isoform X1 [Drosophila erecta]EDV47814.2 uncharacterized protein Dere_GG11411 [Drosophila erecta]